METALLTTKLNIPLARVPLVSRSRLVSRLDEGINYSLTLVSAPAGFGKTTLLSEWIYQNRHPAAVSWLSVEETENDPARFWEYFITALQKIQPGIGEKLLSALRSPQTPSLPLLTPLINEMTDIKNDFFLVLDDYHFIHTEEVHKGLTFLLEHLPPRMHLIISTRSDPPLPLAHFRGKGAMMEIGADDLRFTLEEASLLPGGLNIPALPAEDIRILNEKAEGWAVGLKMALLSLKEQKDRSAFISGFTGTQGYIMDYLLTEVLQQQTPLVKDFLLSTSVLDRLSGPLCNAVANRNDGPEMLQYLEKANLFTDPLDEKRQWYRYEHLFADLLRHRLELEQGKEAVFELQKKASRWYEENGFLENTINYALAAHDWERAIDVILSTEPLGTFGGPVTYNWFSRVPQEVLITRSLAYMEYIWALASVGRMKESLDLLDSYEKSPYYDEKFAGFVATLRVNVGAYLGEPHLEEFAKKALALLPPDGASPTITNTRITVTLHLGVHYCNQYRFDEAVPYLEQAYETALKVKAYPLASQAIFWLGTRAMVKGKMRQAEEMFKRAIQISEWYPNTAMTHAFLGILYGFRNELDKAITEHEKALELYDFPILVNTIYAYICGIRLAQGNIKAAEEALHKAESITLPEENAEQGSARIAGARAELAIAQGSKDAALKWLDKLEGYEGPFDYDVPIPALRLLHERWGNDKEERLKQLYERLSVKGTEYYHIEARIEQALAAKNPGEALHFFSDALARSSPEGITRVFLAFGTDLVPLLRRAMTAGIEPDFSKKLLELIEEDDKRCKARQKEEALFQTGLLSDRELEVLRLLCEDAPNQRIAEKLNISLSTVKTHVHHILNKLEVKDRSQAVYRARELKLV